MENFKGKMLVRKSKLANGQQVIILCGSFYPSEPLSNFDDADEMWAVELEVKDVIKFTGFKENNIQAASPQGFLGGVGQSPKEWIYKNGIKQNNE